MNINAYNLRDIQTFLSLLNQLEAEGITDIRFARERIQSRLNEQAVDRGRVSKRIVRPVKNVLDYGYCPACKTPLLPANSGDHAIKIAGCRTCRYSRIVS